MKQNEESGQILVQCPGCRTHIKAEEAQTCPFCETSLALVPESTGRVMQGPKRSLSRRSSLLVASLFGLSALGGVAIQACDTKAPTEQTATETTGADGGAEKSTPDTATQPDTTTQPETQPEPPPVLPPYGIPPSPDE